MRFTKEVLERARQLTVERHPKDAGGIWPDCFTEALKEFHRKRQPTLIIYR